MSVKVRVLAVLAMTLVGANVAHAQESAKELLKKEDARQKAAAKASAAQAVAHFDVAKRSYDNKSYVTARSYLQKALQLNPNYKEAKELLYVVEDILGVHRASVRTSMQKRANEINIERQERFVALVNMIDKAKEYLNKVRAESTDAAHEAVLADQVQSADMAIDFAERAREIIRWMPVGVNTTEYEKQAQEIIRYARDARNKRVGQLRTAKTKASVERSSRQRNQERRLEELKVGKLIDQLELLFDAERFSEVEDVADSILKRVSNNTKVLELKAAARSQKHLQREHNIRGRFKEEMTRFEEVLFEAGIPYSMLLRYPENWKEIQSRRETSAGAGTVEPQWKHDIRRKLDRNVNFEFSETPLREAVQFLQTMTDTTMVVDTGAFDDGGSMDQPITLRVKNMPLGRALKWILQQAELDFILSKEAVFISVPSKLAGTTVLQIYDVRDLTYTIQDFPGPELSFGGGDDAESGLVSLQESDDPTTIVTTESLAELIRTRVAPASWADELGTSIDQREGKLVVMQKPEIHAMITHLLQTFRETQALQVSVQSRFVEVKDGLLEDIGVQFADIPPFDDTLTPPRSWDTVSPWEVDPINTSERLSLNHPNIDTSNQTTGMLSYDGTNDAYWLRSDAQVPREQPFGTRLGTDTAAGTGQGMLMQFRFVGNVYAQAILHALRKQENGNLLMAPRLTMFNNQRAHIMVAEQSSYISDYDAAGDVYDPIVSTILRGTILDIKPTVSHDHRYVTMDFRPTTSDNLNFRRLEITSDPIYDPVTGLLTSALLNYPYDLPSMRFRTARTTIMVPDGGTVLVSGLMTDVKYDAKMGIPFFSDLPVVGRLFGTDLRQREKVNLLILCSANIILFDEEEAKQM